MQSPYLQLCKPFSTNSTRHLAFRRSLSSETPFRSPFVAPESANPNGKFIVRCVRKQNGAEAGKIKAHDKKHNTLSIDNEMAATEQQTSKQQRQGRRRVVGGKRTRNGPVLVSGVYDEEVEGAVEPDEEHVIKPVWIQFARSLRGIWNGVGAVFSPITAEMEPLEVGKKNEHLYDCYTVSHVKAVLKPSGGQASEIQRKINWVTLNPYGEVKNSKGSKHTASANESATIKDLPTFDSFDFRASDVMEEDVMTNEPGLVFFEDGSYSRGPVDIPVVDVDDSKYDPSPTFKFEQCVVTRLHKRVRIVHTIEFSNGGSEIQIKRVAVYDEVHDESEVEYDEVPLSQRKRIQPLVLSGKWKEFGMAITPMVTDQTNKTEPWDYLCTVFLKKRSLPENHGEEEMQDGSILWLPGGITAFAYIKKDGILCIGAGKYLDKGVNLVMERDYGLDGKLKEVRWKSEVRAEPETLAKFEEKRKHKGKVYNYIRGK